MDAQHTPGPWYYRPIEHDDWGWVRGAPDADGYQWFICQAHDPEIRDEADLNAHRSAGTDPWEANGRLIAAAPEMLQALQDLVRYVDAVRYSIGMGPTQVARLEAAKSVIAKAIGAP